MFGERIARPRSAGRHQGDVLRASDAEREHVVDLLQRAVGMGMLDLDEFGQRTDVALAALTRAELSAVLRDLPGLVPDVPLARGADDVLVLRSRLSEVSRRGQWQVPGRILISSRLGSTRLDFTEARLDHPTLEIELDVTAGSVELLVPAAASVDASAVRVFGGELTDRRNLAHVGGAPRFVLSGRLRAGQVRIYRPSYLRLGRMLVRLPHSVSRAATHLLPG